MSRQTTGGPTKAKESAPAPAGADSLRAGRSVRSRPRAVEPLSADRVNQLFDQLEAIMCKEGFAHLTVAELAARLRCSRRTLYQLAPSKDELTLAVIDRMFRRIALNAHSAADRSTTNREKLEKFLEMTDWPAMSMEFQSDIDEWEPAAQLFDAHIRYALRHRFEDIVECGIADREFRPVNARLLATAVFGAMSHLRRPQSLVDLGMPYADAIEQFHELVVAGLSMPASTAD